jgi:4-hydroxybenzoate polyprenyltransferase
MNTENITKQNNISMFFVEFIRISDVIKWVLISFTGFVLGITSTAITTYLIPFLVFFVSTFFIMSFTFVINNYYDIETDRENPRRMHTNALASGKFTKKAGMGFSVLFVIVALVTSFVFKIEVFLVCILLLLWMWTYSAPPLRIKGRPGMDILWHFGGFVIIVLWGSLLAGSVTTLNWLFAVSVALDSCIGQVWNHYRDYLFDKKSRTKTFAVLVGTDITKKTLNILLGVHLIVLIPLIFFYSLGYFATIIILVSGIVVGFFILQPQKHPFPSKQSIEAYIAIIISGSVYTSCIIYHILSVIGFSPLGLFHGIGIL